MCDLHKVIPLVFFLQNDIKLKSCIFADKGRGLFCQQFICKLNADLNLQDNWKTIDYLS